jgi:hypothetical protein
MCGLLFGRLAELDPASVFYRCMKEGRPRLKAGVTR